MSEITACPTFTVTSVLKHRISYSHPPILHHVPITALCVNQDVNCVLNMVDNICEQIL